MVRKEILVLVGLAPLLSACSSGGSGGGADAPDSYGDYAAIASDLRADLALLERVDPADLPRSGSARYEGVAGFGVGMTTSEQRGMYGAMELTVTFAGDGTIEGRIFDVFSNGNIYDDTGAGPVQGQLVLSNGEVLRDVPDPRFNPYLVADLDGTLVEPGGGAAVYDLRFEGALSGDDLDMVNGNVNGRADGLDGHFGGQVTGTFVGARQ